MRDRRADGVPRLRRTPLDRGSVDASFYFDTNPWKRPSIINKEPNYHPTHTEPTTHAAVRCDLAAVSLEPHLAPAQSGLWLALSGLLMDAGGVLQTAVHCLHKLLSGGTQCMDQTTVVLRTPHRLRRLGCCAALSADLSVPTGSTNVWSRPKNFLMGEFSLYLTPGGGYPPRLCG